MDEFVSAFDGRIRSMAKAHALLSRGRWQGVNLAHLVRQEPAPCAAANSMVEGPDIVLDADAAQPVAFVFHELVTNAAKYGALSIPKGHVRCNGINGRTDMSRKHWCLTGKRQAARASRLRSHQATVPVSSKTSSPTSSAAWSTWCLPRRECGAGSKFPGSG